MSGELSSQRTVFRIDTRQLSACGLVQRLVDCANDDGCTRVQANVDALKTEAAVKLSSVTNPSMRVSNLFRISGLRRRTAGIVMS